MVRKFYIETYGCASNKFDSEKMAGILISKGYELTEKFDDADFFVINSCAVKAITEDKIIFRIERISGKKIVVAGCLTKVNKERILRAAPNASLIGPRSIEKIGEVFDKLCAGERSESFQDGGEKLNLPSFSFNPIIEIIKISEGCGNNCAFCATKIARGDLTSFRPEEIRESFRRGLARGAKEFWITSEDCSSYGKDIGTNLAELLESLCTIEGDFKIRVGMMNPLHLKKEDLKKLAKVFKNDKIFKFLHLCVQSGSDAILKKMKRGYTAKDFVKFAEEFRKETPDITIWTDIIVGFPTENEKDFEDTTKLLEENEYDFANVSRFGVRRGTSAAGMKQVASEVMKKRSKVVGLLVDKIALRKNLKWVGWRGEVIIDEYKKNKKSWIGRNDSYKPVVLKGNFRLGERINVEVIDCERTHLFGKVLNR